MPHSMRADASPVDLPETGDALMLLRAAAAALPGDTPRLDAELLLASALGMDRMAMLASRPLVSDAVRKHFAVVLARRAAHEPVAHILGEREFWSLPLKVTRDVLVPRPDSETLIVDALAARAGRPPASILDLGTGSGALLLAALSEWPQAMGLGIDRSEAALAVARANAEALGFDGRARFRAGDWASGLDGRFDLILCNPPYVPEGEILMPDVALHEPAGALYGGPDGLDPYRLLFPDLGRILAADGVAIFEFGASQAEALAALASQSGLASHVACDLAGRPRALRLWFPNGLGKAAATH